MVQPSQEVIQHHGLEVLADFSRTEFRDLILDAHAAALATCCFLRDRCSPKWLPYHFLHNNYPPPTPQMAVS